MTEVNTRKGGSEDEGGRYNVEYIYLCPYFSGIVLFTLYDTNTYKDRGIQVFPRLTKVGRFSMETQVSLFKVNQLDNCNMLFRAVFVRLLRNTVVSC